MSTQRQIICPVMTFTSLGNVGGKLQVIEYDMTHWSKGPVIIYVGGGGRGIEGGGSQGCFRLARGGANMF